MVESLILYSLGNLLIFSGYAFVGLVVAKGVGLRSWWGRLATALFFITCAVTHMDHFFHAIARVPITIEDMQSPYHVVNATVQGASVWGMIAAVVYERAIVAGDWPPHLDVMGRFSHRPDRRKRGG